MNESNLPQKQIGIVADIVSAYVSNNSVRQADLPELIQSVFSALSSLTGAPKPQAEAPPTPPVPIRRSITPDYIISLEDGKQYRSLKRHLSTRGLTPDQYRAKWGLPPSYPMVAPSYAQQRSELAKSVGLGQLRRKGSKEAAPAPMADVTPEQPKPKRTRKPKAT
jgi:predicted transcriptional regulator